MNIWIDLANSPHVLFFKPLIHKLWNLNHKVILTHRDFAQTNSLCKIFSFDSKCIGVHGGRGIHHKIANVLGRAYDLYSFARSLDIDLACSHNSYAHCIAAKLIKIPYVTIMDYEYQPANHINFRISERILVPFTFKIDNIKKYGATEQKMIKYPGLKEEVYLWEFKINPHFWKEEFPDIDSSKILCTIRPPATMAAYHNFENPLFFELISYLLRRSEVQLIVFPRTIEQRLELASSFPNLYLADKSVEGAQLIANSDMIISAGGTMNREAAVLDTPAYSVYAGRMGSVDQHLIDNGKLVLIKSAHDFKKIVLRKKQILPQKIARKVFDFILDQLLQTAKQNCNYHKVWGK